VSQLFCLRQTPLDGCRRKRQQRSPGTARRSDPRLRDSELRRESTNQAENSAALRRVSMPVFLGSPGPEQDVGLLLPPRTNAVTRSALFCHDSRHFSTIPPVATSLLFPSSQGGPSLLTQSRSPRLRHLRFRPDQGINAGHRRREGKWLECFDSCS
jgi:hypothetical protein